MWMGREIGKISIRLQQKNSCSKCFIHKNEFVTAISIPFEEDDI